MVKKYYAVKKGRKPGVYTSWSDTQKEISGFSNAEFKSFLTKAEADSFISEKTTVEFEETEQTILAYVDGSFDKHSKRYSYGAVLLKGNQIIEELSNADDDPEYAESFQIAGECFGALNAIKWAIQHKYEAVIIHYDYLGIEMWATGKWKANKKISKDYVAFFKKFEPHIKVKFVKVKAHTGVIHNERADQLAKEALF